MVDGDPATISLDTRGNSKDTHIDQTVIDLQAETIHIPTSKAIIACDNESTVKKLRDVVYNPMGIDITPDMLDSNFYY